LLLDSDIKKYTKRFRELGKLVRVTVRRPNGIICFAKDYADLDLLLQAIGNFKMQEEELGWTIELSCAIKPNAEQMTELNRIGLPPQIILSLFAGAEARKVLFSTSSGSESPLSQLEEEITEINLLNHFMGNSKIGIFPEDSGGKCKVACFHGKGLDFETAKKLVERAGELDLCGYIEDPQAVAIGFRVWFFFWEGIEADRIRSVLKKLAEEIKGKEIDICPSDQDDYIYLPFFNFVRNKRAGFIDLENIPYENQSSALIGFERMKRDIIERIISDHHLILNFDQCWSGEIAKDKIEEAEGIIVDHFRKLTLPEEMIDILVNHWKNKKIGLVKVEEEVI